MKISAIIFLSLLSRANAVGLGSLRGEEAEGQIDIDIACTLKGGSSQNTCDDTKSEDGSTCVWCSVSAYGVCVSGTIADQMKQAIPGLDCDDNGNTDDDKAPTPDVDDDTEPNDDSVPDDYWNCIEKYETSDKCTAAGCSWCDNKGGYGICFDEDTAKNFDKSDWYSCTTPSSSGVDSDSLPVDDPSDPTCAAATIGGDESSCKATMDAEGNPCDWCSFQSYEFCVNDDQAQVVEQYGASCGDRVEEKHDASKVQMKNLSDPSDPTCVAATIGGDASSCKATMDVEGNPCDWCSFQNYEFCVNDDQAQVVEQYGASCGDRVEEKHDASKFQMKNLSDPSDPTCVAATIGGDASSCKATMDVEGNPCDWCSFQSYEFCVNGDQAQVVEQYGASCGDRVEEKHDTSEVQMKNLSDPGDPTCVAATIGGDESSCKATMDAEGNPCDWCSFQSYEFCVNGDQAQVVEQYGASCGDRVEEKHDASMVQMKNLSDPGDPTCVAATIGGDASSCKATVDVEGNPCDWCSFQNYEFCVNGDQAQIVEQYGASCNKNYILEDKHDKISDPSDPTCVAATIGGDESSCKATMDVEGNPCDWCSFQNYEFCVNDDQAQVVEQYGASCGNRDNKARNISKSIA